MQMPNLNISNYVEKELFSKRFILAVMIVGYFMLTGQGEALVGAVMGFYFGAKSTKGMTPDTVVPVVVAEPITEVPKVA